MHTARSPPLPYVYPPRAQLCFGQRDQAVAAIQEAVRSAQQQEDNVCLAHALLWMYHAQAGAGADAWGNLLVEADDHAEGAGGRAVVGAPSWAARADPIRSRPLAAHAPAPCPRARSLPARHGRECALFCGPHRYLWDAWG